MGRAPKFLRDETRAVRLNFRVTDPESSCLRLLASPRAAKIKGGRDFSGNGKSREKRAEIIAPVRTEFAPTSHLGADFLALFGPVSQLRISDVPIKFATDLSNSPGTNKLHNRPTRTGLLEKYHILLNRKSFSLANLRDIPIVLR